MQTAYMNHSLDYKAAASAASSSAASATAANKAIDYKRKNVTGPAPRHLAPRFIFECAIKLNMKPLTSATAAIIFHRFYREVESDVYDEYVNEFSCTFIQRSRKGNFISLFISVWFSFYVEQLIASASLCLAGKLKDDIIQIRDVINVTHNTLNRGDLNSIAAELLFVFDFFFG